MTEEIFRKDAYTFNFEAEVVRTDGDSVILDSTAFYPGGGGQVCDTGMLREFAVKEVTRKGDDIVHIVPGHNFRKGEKIWASVDWERRYDLMKGHTAEHLLFGSLKRFAPEIGIVKIFIAPESKYVVIDRDVEWDAVREAVDFANKAIRDNLTVRRVIMDRNDPEMASVRVDLEKVKSNEISVTEIGDVDAAACSGIHVMETEEIGAILVDRKVSAGKDGFAIHFKIGWEAIDSAVRLANACLQVSDVLGSKPEDIVRSASNVKEQLEESKRGLNDAVSASIGSLEGEDMNGTKLFSGIFPAADGKVFTDASDRFRGSGSVSVLISAGTQASVYIASGSDRVDAGSVLKDVLPKFGGRGGGKKEFAQGGVPDVSEIKKVLDHMVSAVKKYLS